MWLWGQRRTPDDPRGGQGGRRRARQYLSALRRQIRLADKYQLAQRMREADEATAGEGPRERLRAQVHAYCQFAGDNPGHYRLMYEIRQPPVEWSKARSHPARQVSGRFRAAFAACVEAGHTLRLPQRQSAHILWTGLHGFITIQHTVGLPAEMTLLRPLADGLLDTLGTDSRANGPRRSVTRAARVTAATLSREPRPAPSTANAHPAA
jgi:hypothetical protein